MITGSLWKKFGMLRSKISIYDSSTATVLLSDYIDKKYVYFSKSEYESVDFRETIRNILISNRKDGLLHVPKELGIFVESILLPGHTLNLFSGAGMLTENIAFTGIENNSGAIAFARLLRLNNSSSATFIHDNPFSANVIGAFSNVVTIPPMGIRPSSLLSDLMEQISKKLKDSGQAIIILPESVLSAKSHSELRHKIWANYDLEVILSLPTSTFSPYTGIKTSILVLRRNSQRSKTLMMNVNGLDELEYASKAISSLRNAYKPEIGFLKDLRGQKRWDVPYQEPLDYSHHLQGVRYPYRIDLLKNIAIISSGKKIDGAHFAINKTGNPKPIALGEAPEKHSYFVKVHSGNPDYIQAFLSSDIGKRTISRVMKGSTIPYISLSDVGEIELVLPELDMQDHIASTYQEINTLSEKMTGLIDNARFTFHQNPFDHIAVSESLAALTERTDDTYSNLLPFPIAIVHRKLQNTQNYQEKYQMLVELFDSTIRYVVLINLSDYLGRMKDDNTKDIIKAKDLQRPSLGNWVSTFFALCRIKSKPDSEPFLSEFKHLKIDRYKKLFQGIVEQRNRHLGHGATMSDYEYKNLYDELQPMLLEISSKLGFMSNYKLVKPISLSYDDKFTIKYTDLSGDNSHFKQLEMTSLQPIKTGKVLLIKQDGSHLSLDPFIVLDQCQECGRTELLLFDKFDKKGVTYLSFETGHKSKLPTLGLLPNMLAELLDARI